MSYFWRSLQKKFGTNLLYSTTSHLQIDGQIEVTNCTLGNLICCLNGNKPHQWILALAQAEFAFNNMVDRSTAKCPFEIVYTHVPRLTMDCANLPISVDVSVKVNGMADRVKSLHEEVRAHFGSC